ncbi:hypothetical protein HZ992_16520 [Rhizobacter sp. AJA081-3]|uniref:hypothetical protein n=1 Tax=Rhizobacter sp. AJA081-3 TaxID=2753607 RepID=UPI001ADEF4D3|nr:hypothetical protein [Rhizobacter sp. AJA081-3]QTN21771.1 hypothetical protein HZ992_16520 [Rhizobacter sp. AJA081-3]
MHAYDELSDHGMEFSLSALNEAYERVVEELQTSSATRLVKALQMVQLQKAVLAVGMFSMFEAMLQDDLNCTDGFREAAARLDANGETALRESLGDLQLAINVLKHGRGRSYDTLVGKANALPFRVKLPDEHFFNEGDVSEVSTLIDVDDAFVRRCAAIIREVTAALG